MKKTAIALSTAASIFSTASLADHTPDNARLFDDQPHFTVACTDENGNVSDNTLSIVPELSAQGDIHAIFNARTINSPFPSLVQGNVDSLLEGGNTQPPSNDPQESHFSLFIQSSNVMEPPMIDQSFYISIDPDDYRAIFHINNFDSNSGDLIVNNRETFTCDIPDMGF